MIWPGRIDVRARTGCRDTVWPSTATFAAAATSCGVKNAPYFGRPGADQRKVDVGALDLRVPVLVAGDRPAPRVFDAGRDVLHAGHLRAAPARPRASSVRGVALPPWRTPPCVKLPAMTLIMLVPADLTCSSIVRLRARAERHHRDDGADADDHAEHGQRRAHLVAVRAP